MGKDKVELHQDNNCYYLLQSLKGMSLYQKTKAREKFVKTETKVLESCIENELRNIFSRNGINVYETTESVLKSLFSALNDKGKDIEIVDLYETKELYGCTLVGTSPNKMTIWEEDETLQCGVMVNEIDLRKEKK